MAWGIYGTLRFETPTKLISTVKVTLWYYYVKATYRTDSPMDGTMSHIPSELLSHSKCMTACLLVKFSVFDFFVHVLLFVYTEDYLFVFL